MKKGFLIIIYLLLATLCALQQKKLSMIYKDYIEIGETALHYQRIFNKLFSMEDKEQWHVTQLKNDTIINNYLVIKDNNLPSDIVGKKLRLVFE